MLVSALTSPRRAAQAFGRMRGGRLLTSLRGAVVIPLFLAAVCPDSVRTLVCRYTGEVMSEKSSCPEQARQDLESHAQLRDESCCIAKTVQFVKAVSERQMEFAASPAYDAPVACILPELSAAGVQPLRGRVLVSSTGPPIVLLKHAFLI
jgi:hypothetical protein